MKPTNTQISVQRDDIDDLQARLNTLPGSKNNIFSSNSWNFQGTNGLINTIDFDIFSSLCKDYADWVNEYSTDFIFITKRIWLTLAEYATVNQYAIRLSGLWRFFTVLAQCNIDKLSRDNLDRVISFLLTHRWHQGRAIKYTGIISYTNFSHILPLKHLKWAITESGINLIDRGVTDAVLKKHLKQIIPEVSDDTLTYRDWFEGGSFNLLTLDYGRYYVEHCHTFFNENISLATALAKTYRSIPEIAETLNYDHKTVSYLVPRILQGYKIEELHSQLANWSLNTTQRVYDHVTVRFEKAYRKARFDTLLLSDSETSHLLTTLGLRNTSENIDRIRVITWDYLQRKNKQDTIKLLERCDGPTSWHDFERFINELYQRRNLEACIPPSQDDYKHLGLFEPTSSKDASRSYPRQLIRLVEAAGLTCFVALTGWRKSEFGFPFSAIKQSTNLDKLDEYAFPFRYQVDWHIYKTHGKVRQLREITFSTAVLATQISKLIGTDKNAPCLYYTTPAKRDLYESCSKVSNATIGLWEHYIHHYRGFKLLDDHQSWQQMAQYINSGMPLSFEQKRQQAQLLKLRSADNWNNIKIDGNLKEAWLKCREEWPRLEFSSYGRNLRAKKDWLARYRNNRLRSDWSELLDKHLSQETKDWITSLTDDECRSPVVAKTVMNELLTDTLYPSPHAFRHMWAEAIYRRFDGDAGWMIRSQFKHISRKRSF